MLLFFRFCIELILMSFDADPIDPKMSSHRMKVVREWNIQPYIYVT